MNERTRQGLRALEAALLLGVLGDALLRATPWGLNFFLWTSALLAATVALLERHRWREGVKDMGGWLLWPIILSSAAFAWRDSPTLKWLDALTALCAFGLIAWRASGAQLKRAGLCDYARGLLRAGLNTCFGSLPLVFADIKWREIPRNGWSRHALAIVRGLLIAMPLLVVFGALFMAADAIFARYVNRAFRFDLDALISHGFLFALFAWLSAGYLRGLLVGALSFDPPDASHTQSSAAQTERTQTNNAQTDRAQPTNAPTNNGQTDGAQPNSAPPTLRVSVGAVEIGVDLSEQLRAARRRLRFSLGAVEIGVVLGLLDALFLGFVCVQVRYLFGGASWVMATNGLTYAEYARRGFFELVWATALVLPLLLALHWLLRPNDRGAARLFRALALAQIALLFVVIASAITRMRLYQSEYGLTELRLYTTAFMGWLALVFVWFAATVLRDARPRFMSGALVAALFVLGALHLINPDAFIVRANLAHARQGHAFDAAYAVTLSADAIPTLVNALPHLSDDERCLAARELLARWSGGAYSADWRAWSMARGQARRAISTHEASLRAWACARPVETTTTTTDVYTGPSANNNATTTTNAAQPLTNNAPPANANSATTTRAPSAVNNTTTLPMNSAPTPAPRNSQTRADALKNDARKGHAHW